MKSINAKNESIGIRKIFSTTSPLKLSGLFFIPMTLNSDLNKDTINNIPKTKKTNPTISLLLILLKIIT